MTEGSQDDAMKLPVMNNAIPETVSRPHNFWNTPIKAKTLVAAMGISMVVAIPLTAIDYNYSEQAHEVHHIYTSKFPDRERLTVNEELSFLREQGYSPKSWAVEFLGNIGSNNYITTNGLFEPKR